MIEHFPCSVCGGQKWQVLLECEYDADRLPEDEDLKRRFRVLFEVWFPNRSSVELHLLACERCGFVCYSPRPTKSDLNDKYSFLQEYARENSLENGERQSERERLNEKRALGLYKQVSRYLAERENEKRILDYGGGQGQLMAGFADAGWECELIDYNSRTVPFVTKIGNTVKDANVLKPYNCIVLSHVLEHVADPLNLCRRVLKWLKKEGIIYVEVPFELWGGLPNLVEPVTHVNWFTPGSLTTLMHLAGADVTKCEVSEYWSQPSDRLGECVVAIGRQNSNSKDEPFAHLLRDLEVILAPSFYEQLKHKLHTPRITFRNILHRLNLR